MHEKKLNNVEYSTLNFVHPNIFTQNGIFIYYVEFNNNKDEKQVQAKLVKLNIITAEKSEEDINFDLSFISEDKPVYALFANFSTVMNDRNH